MEVKVFLIHETHLLNSDGFVRIFILFTILRESMCDQLSFCIIRHTDGMSTIPSVRSSIALVTLASGLTRIVDNASMTGK